jgi:N utilization substance protein A
MATRKKTKKSNSRKKVAPRKNSKRTASTGSRKVSAKARTAKSKTAKAKPKPKPKTRTSQAKATKNAKPLTAATGRTAPRNTGRIIRSSLASRGEGQSVETINLEPKGLGSKSGGQSGALQGLSDVESADSESVDELLEEGNAFEAEVVKGVEDAPEADEGEVRTHQRPQEEDLPEDFREN